MKLLVDIASRNAKMRAHTATHLLHFVLDTLLGGTKQSGSFVDDDLLRFDFSTKRPLSNQEIKNIEIKINQWIYDALPVSSEEMSYDKAIAMGAKAFFEDKYGDIVRLVSILGRNTNLRSIELCGGTHVINTKNIGAFTIISQEAVASGIRRITAITGPKVVTQIYDLRSQMRFFSTLLDCQPKQSVEKFQKFLKDYKHLKESYESIQTHIIIDQLQILKQQFKEYPPFFEKEMKNKDILFINISTSTLKDYNFKDIVLQAKQLRSQEDWLLVNNIGNFAFYIGSGNFSAKEYIKTLGWKGGGSDQLVQGKESKICNLYVK